MRAEIVSIHNHGDFDKEYVLITVLEDCDIGRFVMADSTYAANGKVSNKLRHTHWFPDKQVKKGDWVSLWTKTGADITTTLNGVPMHRFFWNLKTAVWNDEGDCAVPQELLSWQFFKANG